MIIFYKEVINYGSWFMVHGSWFMVHGSWFMVHGTRFKVHGSWYPCRTLLAKLRVHP